LRKIPSWRIELSKSYFLVCCKAFNDILRINSMQMFLQENPEYVAQGVTLAQFSFQIPRPLWQDYVKKKPKLINSSDEASTITSKSSKPEE
ncbi:hypothetical protein ACJX0J_031496, partial [Zea mays]